MAAFSRATDTCMLAIQLRLRPHLPLWVRNHFIKIRNDEIGLQNAIRFLFELDAMLLSRWHSSSQLFHCIDTINGGNYDGPQYPHQSNRIDKWIDEANNENGAFQMRQSPPTTPHPTQIKIHFQIFRNQKEIQRIGLVLKLEQNNNEKKKLIKFRAVSPIDTDRGGPTGYRPWGEQRPAIDAPRGGSAGYRPQGEQRPAIEHAREMGKWMQDTHAWRPFLE